MTPDAPSLFTTWAPVLIVLLFCGVAGLTFYAGGEKAYRLADPYTASAKEKLERAGMTVSAEKLAAAIMIGTVALWIALLAFLRMPLIMSLFAFPALLLVMFKAVDRWVLIRISRRQNRFVNELEGVLRVLASGVRAGLTIRQAIVLVTEEAKEPARYEFKLLQMQTNVGVSMNDALERMAQRMPSPEVQMFTRAIVMQSQTGGNLVKILDQLGDTIKERRRIHRKIRTITSEARGSTWILGALPPLTFLIMLASVPDFRYPTFHSMKGLGPVAIGTVMEIVCVYTLHKMSTFRV